MTLRVTPASALSNASVMTLPTATTCPSSVAGVSAMDVLNEFTTSGSCEPVAVIVTVWLELVKPSDTVTV